MDYSLRYAGTDKPESRPGRANSRQWPALSEVGQAESKQLEGGRWPDRVSTKTCAGPAESVQARGRPVTRPAESAQA